jgi:hypothetical protein
VPAAGPVRLVVRGPARFFGFADGTDAPLP